MSVVRMSELIDPIESTSPAKEGVNTLRARFENFGQSENKPTIKQNSPGRSSSPLRPLTPPVRRGPQRPPPPRPVRPPRPSDAPSPEREQVRSPVNQLGQNQEHPLTNARTKSLGDLNVIKKDKESEQNSPSVSRAAVEEVDTPTKKEKNKRRKSKSKDDLVEEGSGTGKKFWQKSKSTDVKNSPKVVPDKRKLSAPGEGQDLPRSVPKKEPLATASEVSSTESSSKEGTPDSGRRKSESWKRALKKTESNMTELGSEGHRRQKKKGLAKSRSTSGIGDTGSESDMSSGTPRGSPWIVRKKETRKTDLTKEAKRIKEAAVVNEGKELTASKLEPILRKELVCLTGGLEAEKHQILVVMERNLPMVDSPSGFEEFKTTLSYFKAIMRPEYIDNGATLLVDARDSKSHKAAKHLLERIAEEKLPLSVHMVYLLMKTSFFAFSRKSLVSSEVASKLHLACYNEPRQLVEELGGENVVQEMGGSLAYSHEIWLGNRLEYERIVHLHTKIMARLPETKEALNTFSVPSTVKDAEQLMQNELDLKEKMINLFAESELKMDQFLSSLKEQEQHLSNTMDVEAMTSSVQDMLAEIKTSQNKFDEFWRIHRSRVEHMMRMCHFSRSGEKLKHIMLGHIADLADDKAVLGESLEAALEQGEKHEAFATKCMETVDEQMTKIKTDAADLCNPNFAPSQPESDMHATTQKAIEAVRSQLQELTKTYEKLMTTCQQKRDRYIMCVKFHMNLRQLQQWNDETMELLASLPLEEPSPSAALNLLGTIDQSLMSMTPTQVDNLTQLASTLSEYTFKKKNDSANKKYEHARQLLEQRKAYFQKILTAHFPHPVAPPSPQPSHIQKTPENGHNEPDMHPQLTPDRRSLTSTMSSVGSETSDYLDTETDPGVLRNRQYVYKELVATEQDYIKDLSTVIDSYYDEMDPESVSIPLRLRGKRGVVFGNLLDIKTFHETTFSKALEKYADTPERIGECFMQHSVQFQMYSLYCKNRSNSETLINESTESQAFFKGIQLKLGHALHLNSYLLKPIQRVTKYQLLLKDMLKHAAQAKRAHSDLQVALESMLKVLKNLNDSLHVLGVKGFPGALAEQGRLLVHDPFQVADNAGRFSRMRERHVFLFEKVIIVSKKVEAPVQKKQKKSDAYIYKDHIEMALVRMRDSGDKHGLQFQITIHGQNKLYIFQATRKEVKDMWMKEIGRLLQAQFSLMKDMVFQSGTLDRSNYRGKARPVGISRDSRLFGDSFRAPPRGTNPKKSLAVRLFGKKANKRPEPTKGGKKFEPSASLPSGLGHAIRPVHSLTPCSAESEVSEDKSDSISSDDELAFSSDEEDGLATTAVDHYESLAPGAPRYYTATTKYDPGATDNGVKLTSGQEIEVIGINKYGWWWVRSTNHYTSEVEEGWVPACYLQISPDQTLPGDGCPMSAGLSGLRKKT